MTLDEMVHHYVFGNELPSFVPTGEYTQNASNAMYVLFVMRTKGFVVTVFSDWCGMGKWVCKFTERGGLTYWHADESLLVAICRAAVWAMTKDEHKL